MKSNIILFRAFQKKEGITMCEILKNIQGKTALELLNNYNIELKPPINITQLLKNLKISAIATDFSKIEKEANIEPNLILGAALSVDESLTIFYREKDTYNRQLFTIAHELGHCCLDTDSLMINHLELRTDTVQQSNKEYKANVFAGELLIPEIPLKNIYNELIIPSLDTLAKIFGVSTNVMAARLDYLNLQYLKDTVISEE